jgi:hypothetical protein
VNFGSNSDFLKKGLLASDPYVQDLDTIINGLRKHLFSHFVNKWSSHHCDHSNCKKALNIDGNHKVNRLKCMYDNIYLNSKEIKSQY